MSMIQVRHFSVAPEKIAELTARHIARYRNMVEAAVAGRPGIRIGECNHYLRIWRSILEKGPGYADLAPDESRELYEALIDEDDCEPTEVA